MVAAIHQPNHLPWLGYFYKMMRSDVFILLDDAQYSKGSYINRTRIKGSAGPVWLTVPVKSKGRAGQAIQDVEIDVSSPVWLKQPRIVDANYGKAPHFPRFGPWLESIYSRGWTSLTSLNVAFILEIASILGIKTKIILSSSLHCEGTQTARLIALCKAVGADVYLSGRGGGKYQDQEAFESAGIKLRYAEFNHPRYPQLWGGFLEGLSVLDLLLNCGEQSREILDSTGQTAEARSASGPSDCKSHWLQ